MNEARETTMIEARPRQRRGKKRLVFQPPRHVPSSVRSLWETASAEEKAKSHTTCVAILSMWLGKKSRQQVGSELELPPLRVWQLSQMALSGMLAGLLKQPRGRGKVLTMATSSEEDPRVLKKRIAELEADNRSLRELLEVLKDLPSARAQPAPRPRTRPVEEKRGKKAVQRDGEGSSGGHARGTGETSPR